MSVWNLIYFNDGYELFLGGLVVSFPLHPQCLLGHVRTKSRFILCHLPSAHSQYYWSITIKQRARDRGHTPIHQWIEIHAGLDRDCVVCALPLLGWRVVTWPALEWAHEKRRQICRPKSPPKYPLNQHASNGPCPLAPLWTEPPREFIARAWSP